MKSVDLSNLKKRKKGTDRVDGIFLYGFSHTNKFYSNCFAHILLYRL